MLTRCLAIVNIALIAKCVLSHEAASHRRQHVRWQRWHLRRKPDSTPAEQRPQPFFASTSHFFQKISSGQAILANRSAHAIVPSGGAAFAGDSPAALAISPASNCLSAPKPEIRRWHGSPHSIEAGQTRRNQRRWNRERHLSRRDRQHVRGQKVRGHGTGRWA